MRKTVWILVLCIAVFGISCGKKTGEETAQKEEVSAGGESAQSTTPQKKWKIGFSQCTLDEPWRVAMNLALETRANDFPDLINLEMLNASDDAVKQAEQVDTLRIKGVDILIISPKEAAPLTPPVKKVHESGIPVIVLDRDLSEPAYTCFIGASNLEIGREAGEFVAEQAKKKMAETGQKDYKVVMLQGNLGSTPAGNRRDGFLKGIEGVSGIEIIAKPDCQWKLEEARTRMENILQSNPHIDCVYGHNDPMAIGARLAAADVGRENEMIFVGIDALRHEGVREVMEGNLSATFIYPTCGKEAIDTALKILRGEEVPKRITLPTARVTPENAEQWYEELPPSKP
jgi:ribose transport system substrate-binding protein